MSAYLILDTQIIPIDKLPFKIGRALENHLVIQEATLSRFHAEIHKQGDRYYLVDNQSTGGSSVNDRTAGKVALHNGDSIILAGTALVFVDQDARQLSERSKRSTGPLDEPVTDNDPTILQVKPDWRPQD